MASKQLTSEQLSSFVEVFLIKDSHEVEKVTWKDISLRKYDSYIFGFFIGFEVNAFMTIVFVDYYKSIGIFFVLLQPLDPFIVFRESVTLDFINKTFDFLKFRILIIFSILHDSIFDDSALSREYSSEIA